MWDPFGYTNPIAVQGQAQVQLVLPTKDPKDAYLRYTDHAYLNLNSTDPGEIPTGDFVSGGAKDVLSGSRTQHSGGFRGYPANIKGDQIMRFDVPFGEMGHRLQDKVHQQIGFMYGGLPGEITSTDAAVAAAERARREEEEKGKNKGEEDKVVDLLEILLRGVECKNQIILIVREFYVRSSNHIK